MRPTGGQEAVTHGDSSDVELISPSPTTCDVRDLQDGSAVDQVLLVREREIRRTRAGADYRRLALADRTGTDDRCQHRWRHFSFVAAGNRSCGLPPQLTEGPEEKAERLLGTRLRREMMTRVP